MKTSTQERGWGGHFICAERCLFRRNTLLDNLRFKVIVSTVGNFIVDGKLEAMGPIAGQNFETMVFASSGDKWDDINPSRQLDGARWDTADDTEANRLHETMVAKWREKMDQEDFTIANETEE